MRYDRRLSRVLHVLLHLEGVDEAVTSKQLSEMLCTDPTFVRRTMAGLRERGWVSSSRGQGGGWRLQVPLSDISLQALYEALGSPGLFAVAPSEDAPRCLMEQAANAAVGRALQAAESAFHASISEVTVADLAEDYARRAAATGRTRWTPPDELLD